MQRRCLRDCRRRLPSNHRAWEGALQRRLCNRRIQRFARKTRRRMMRQALNLLSKQNGQWSINEAVGRLLLSIRGSQCDLQRICKATSARHCRRLASLTLNMPGRTQLHLSRPLAAIPFRANRLLHLTLRREACRLRNNRRDPKRECLLLSSLELKAN